MATAETDPDYNARETYQFDPHIDPQLQWAGKAEHTSFEVPTVSLHVHERIDPCTIIEAVRKSHENNKQPFLFDQQSDIPLRQAIEFYQHPHGWSNRLIAGDSLLVMNSLLQKENMADKVQCVYMDPPFGIKYGSNFQPFVGNMDVKDGKAEDLSAEPETIKAFRDTWECGIHSYLSCMRDRLLLIRELLTESGSVFVQIGDENVHRLGLLMDEIFGADNRVATITFATTGSSPTALLPQVEHYLLWYGKNIKHIKFRQIYEQLSRREIVEFFSWSAEVELAGGASRPLKSEERFDPDQHLPEGARLYRHMPLQSQGASTTGRSEPYIWNGQTYRCGKNAQWRISKEDIDQLARLGRLSAATEGQSSLNWKRYEEEVPGRKINNIWPKPMSAKNKNYVVETASKVIERCLLMSTDPGDLVLDPTCGSGTTAYVAEQWGRRWITCDSSRVATTLAKQRLMTAVFDYYKLAHPKEGVGSGFEYDSVPKVSAKILASGAPQSTILYDRPKKDKKKARVTGPFTVEAVPAPTVRPLDEIPSSSADTPRADASIARSGETRRQHEWRDELLKTGIRGRRGQRINFSRIEPWPGRHIHADAETKADDSNNDDLREAKAVASPQRAAISFGPEHAPLERKQVELALKEANRIVPKPDMVVFAAFQFDPEAAKDIDETVWGGTALIKAQMNADLQTGDLKKKRISNESFWLIGQPEIELEHADEGDASGKWRVRVRGFDYFNIKTGKLDSGGEQDIAMWMLDTDYDGRSLYPKQVFFPMAGAKDGWTKLAKSLRAEMDSELIEKYKGTVSLPFEAGENKRIAVKIVDNRGIESLKVKELS